uniref:Maturase-related protein n=1 Tax=Araucaria cunninghamii TaxID=56994 RepID=A0A8F4RG14_ARACU|nr:maturase-related protein [Araucaria cunninghamii]
MLKFRPLTVVVPREKIMKRAIRAVLESIYDPEFLDTSHFRPGRGCHSALMRIRKEWGTSRWFLEFGIRKFFHTIDRLRLISILKEEIDGGAGNNSLFFRLIQKLFSAGRPLCIKGGERKTLKGHSTSAVIDRELKTRERANQPSTFEEKNARLISLIQRALKTSSPLSFQTLRGIDPKEDSLKDRRSLDLKKMGRGLDLRDPLKIGRELLSSTRPYNGRGESSTISPNRQLDREKRRSTERGLSGSFFQGALSSTRPTLNSQASGGRERGLDLLMEEVEGEDLDKALDLINFRRGGGEGSIDRSRERALKGHSTGRERDSADVRSLERGERSTFISGSRRPRGGRPSSVPHSVLLSALPGNIYLHKLDQEIERIRQKHEIPIVQIIKLVLLGTGRIDDDQGNSGKEAKNNSPRDNRAAFKRGEGRFSSLVSSWHTPRTSRRGDQKPFGSPPSSGGPLAFFNKPSSLYSNNSAFLVREGWGLGPLSLTDMNRERRSLSNKKNGVIMKNHPSSKSGRRGLLIELGGEAVLVTGLERRLARKQGLSPVHFDDLHLIRICYARYADDFLLGIVGTVELMRKIQKRITHFLQSGLNLEVGSAGFTTIAARSRVEFLGTVIREVPKRPGRGNSFGHSTLSFKAPNSWRELEKRRRAKHRIHLTASHLRSAIHSKFEDLGRSIPVQQLCRRSEQIPILRAHKCPTSKLALSPPSHNRELKRALRSGNLQDAVQLADTLGTAGVISPRVSVGVLWETVKHIWRRSGEIPLPILRVPILSSPAMDKAEGYPKGHLCTLKGRGIPSSFGRVGAVSDSKPAGKSLSVGLSLSTPRGAHQESSETQSETRVKAPVRKILQRLRDRGIISRRRAWPTHVACLTNVSDEDIINWFAGVAISLLSHYRCCDNFYQVRTIVDYQIRWSAIFTLAHKHKSSARKIILKYSKDLHIVNGGKTLAESPNSMELRKLGPLTGKDLNYLDTEHAYKTFCQVYIRDV